MVLLILAVPSLSLLFLQNRQVQTKVSQLLAEQLSEQLQSNISLSSVNYTFFKRVQIRDLYIEDLHGDTLIYSELTKVRIKQIRPDKGIIEIRKITLQNAGLNLVIEPEGGVNLGVIIDRGKKPHVPPERKNKLHIHEIIMNDGWFSLTKSGHPPLRSEIDFRDFDMLGLEITLEDLVSEMDTISMNIISLTGVEKCGFEFHHLKTLMSIGKYHMHFNDLEVDLPGSELHVPVLGFNFDDWQGFKGFSREVDLTFESIHSQINIQDLFTFIPASMTLLDQLTLDGRVHGKLNDLKGDEMEITFDQRSTLAFDFAMIGLPDFKNTFLDYNFREFNSTVPAIYQLISARHGPDKQSLYPWINMGNIDFKGQFTGYPDNFVASGFMQTDMGRMLMDLSFKPDSSMGIDFHGQLRTGDFKLGEFLGQEELLSQLDMDVLVDGNLNDGAIHADLKGSIDTLYFSDYAYSNISLDGAFTNTTFNGGFSISDPNIRMDFLGRMDFSGEVPTYNFTADVARSRPHYLNLAVEDPNTFASFRIETDITGSTLDELNGEVRLVNSLFERNENQVQLYDVRLSALSTPDTTSLEIKSEMLDASIDGKFRLTSLPAALENMADFYINYLPGKNPEIDTINRFTYHADLYHVNPILDFFFPSIQIADGSHVSGSYIPLQEKYDARGSFPELEIGPSSWSDASFLAATLDGEFDFQFQSDSMVYGKNYALVDQQFHLFTLNDTANLHLTWNNHSEMRYSGEIDLKGAFQSNGMMDRRVFNIEVEPSELYIDNEIWFIDRSDVRIAKKYLNMDSLTMRSLEKHMIANGTIASGGSQEFNLDFRNLNLSELTSLIGTNANLHGNITGNFTFRETEGQPYIFSDVNVDTLFFNEQIMGPTALKAVWNDSRRTIGMMLRSNLENKLTIDVDGEFTPENKALDFEIRLNEFKLQSLTPYVQNLLEDLAGTGDVALTLDGTLDQPKLNGNIAFNQGAATISFLNSRYTINESVRIYNNNLYFENLTATDKFGNQGIINGTISNNHFKDFYTNISITANNLNCMDTRSIHNDQFYGTIFASGDVSINGAGRNIDLSVRATTEENTALFLPLYNAREVQTSDFITFIHETDLEILDLPIQKKMGELNVELEVDITEDAMVQLIFDPKVGDIIETSGRGTLRIFQDQNQGLRMFGDVELLKGEYLFTLQNVINKRFEIEPGGKILFNGSPTNSTIDLAAIYGTRVAPYNLYQGDPSDEYAESMKKRIPVECHLNLQGDLRSPTIVAGIEMPTADPETRGVLANATGTEEELMKQFLSLLVINDFYSVSGYGLQNMGTMNSSFAGVTASELLSNQLSNWLSQISDDFDIGFTYRPGDQVSTQELEVALSTQLLNDRVIISGNLDVGGQETNPSSGQEGNPYIMGDFEVEYKVTDNVSVLAFNRSRDELIALTAPYKQGFGVSYREEFDSFNQLMARYKEGLTNRKKKKKKSKKTDSEE